MYRTRWISFQGQIELFLSFRIAVVIYVLGGDMAFSFSCLTAYLAKQRAKLNELPLANHMCLIT